MVLNLRFTNNQLKDFKIVDICKLKQGNQYDLKQQFTEEKTDLKRFIRVVDYTQKTNDIRYVYSNGSENYVDCTDVVVVRYGASAGYVGRGINGIIANNLFTIRPINSALLNKSYLYHYLNAPVIQKKLNNTQSSGMPALNFQTINNLHILLPEYQEQHQISVFLDKIDERIQTQIKIINALDSQRRCLFLKAHRAFSLKKVKIAELGRMVAVNNLSKDELSIEGYDCILYGELFTKYNLYVDNVVSKTEKMDNAIVSGGNELLFPTSTTVDAISLIKPVALIKKGVILGGDMFSIKLKDSYNPIYISCLINFIYRRKFASKTQGSTIIHLHYRDIKNEIIEICDYEVQCKIAHLIESITEKIKVEEELLNLLYLQKSYLLQNMFI